MKHAFAVALLMLARFASADTVPGPVQVNPSSAATCQAAGAVAAEAAASSVHGFACALSGTVDVQYFPPITTGYTKCADEGGTCDPKGAAKIIYGAGQLFTPAKQFSAATPCTNAVFGDPAYGVVKACWFKSTATTTAWVLVATQEGTIADANVIRYGSGTQWTTPQPMAAGSKCTPTAFGLPQAGYNQGLWCEAQLTVPAVVQGAPGTMPVINDALIPPQVFGSKVLQVRALTTAEKTPPSPYIAVPADIGAFREPCTYSHMGRSDPIVYPGQEGVSHMHTLSGNDGANGSSTYQSLISTGGSTCAGGIANRTAYWMPTIVDISTGQPVPLTDNNQYYKLGYLGMKAGTIQPFPPGLKMIAGNSKATTAQGMWPARWSCSTGTLAGQWQDHLPTDCAPGSDLMANINFPSCWDGKNLDSPDHKSHMAYAVAPNGCPADHPVPVPDHSQNWHYTVEEKGATNWRLSSDMYVGPAGYSLHSDWFGAWDPATIQKFVANCINASLDCHDYLLGLTETLY